nr:hypothetical protein [Haloarcula sp. CBA1127]
MFSRVANTTTKINDTDGDGLSDSREIGQYAEVKHRGRTASYYNHVAHPRQIDTDGDGLSDDREVRNMTIVTFDSKTEANALREAMVTDNQSLNLQAAGTVLNVTSSALNPDTDGDGISDAEEWRYRTNPRQVDTDNDGIPDTTEFHDGLDPTLHDIRGPAIKSLRTDSYNPAWAGPHYVLDFRVRDRSGLGTVRIAQRGNETLDRTNFTGHTQYHYSQELTGNALQSAGTFAGGTEVYIYAYDSHGNKRRVPALTRSNNIVNNLQGHYGTIGTLEAKTFGRGSGLMHGAGEIGYTISNPVETAAGLSQVPNALANYGRTYESMETQFKNRQRVNNPFPPNTPENESFARGYFDGYMGFLVIEELTGAAVTKAASDSSRVARQVNKIDNTRYLGKSVTAARQLKYASELPARGVGRVASFGVDQAKRPFARYSLRNSRTVGKVVRTRRYVADKTPQKVYDLNTKQRKLSARYFRDADLGGRSPSELETAGKLMAENNPKQVSRMLRRMDDGQQAAFLSDDLDEAARADLYKTWKNGDNVGASDVAEATSADPQTVRLIADGSGDVDDAYDRAIIRAANSDSIDSNKQLHRVVRKVNDLGGTQQRRAKQLIADTDGAGVKLVDELGDDTLRKLLGDTDIDAVDLSRATREYGDLDEGEARQFRRLLDDDDLRKSWIRAAGDPDISKQSVTTALKQVDSVSDDVTITSFKPASDIDVDSDPYYSSWYDDPESPYDADTIVIDGKADESLSVYRFWDSTRNNHEAGPWATDADDIDRLRSDADVGSDEIVDRYALPGDADKVTRLDVDEGTTVRISEAGENFGHDGGGIQYEIRGEDMMDESRDLKMKDLPAIRDGKLDMDTFLSGDSP